MKKQYLKIKAKIINETFNDKRKIVREISKNELELDENVHNKGTFFEVENGEIIDLEFQHTDFNEQELVKYVEVAENIYEKVKKHVSIYIVCPKEINVLVKECDIKSEAYFTIKLACIYSDSCKIILDSIKEKIKNNIPIDSKDMEVLSILPVMCDKKDRQHYRLEYFKILNNHY